MTAWLRACRSPVLLAAAFLVGAGAARAADDAAPPRLTAAFSIRVGGLGEAASTITAEFGGGAYQISSKVETMGLGHMLTGFLSKAETTGRLADGLLRPVMHKARNLWTGEDRRVDSLYDADGLVHAVAVPDAEADGRDVVPPPQAAGTVDPLSAGMAIILGVADGHDRLVQVYDGRRRYNLFLHDIQPAQLATPLYSGGGWRAKVTLTRLAGFSRSPLFPRSAEPLTALLQFAPGASWGIGLPVPLLIETPTDNFGMAVISLSTLSPSGSAADGTAGTTLD